MARQVHGLPTWCARQDLLDLWETARSSRHDILPRLMVCDVLDSMWNAREAGREAAGLAECLRASIAGSEPPPGWETKGTATAHRGGPPRVEPAVHSLGAIPAIWGALGGWPLASRFNHADRVARLWLMSPVSHRLARDTWMEMVPVHHPSVPFLVSKVPVTHSQWEAVWGGRLLDSMPDRPKVVPVDRARDFCRRLASLTSIDTWLPTEPQWESAVDGWEANPACKEPGAHLAARLRAGGPNNLGLCQSREAAWEWCQVPETPGDSKTAGAGWVARRLRDPSQRNPPGDSSPSHGFRVVQLPGRDGTGRAWDFEVGLT